MTDFELEYQNSVIGNQRNKVNIYEDDLSSVFESRTFCLFEDIEKIQKNGLAKGGSLDNAIVVDGFTIKNQKGLRRKDEFVRHKMLDALGDLSLSGLPLLGHYISFCGGHRLNNQLLINLFSDKSNYENVVAGDDNPHKFVNKNFTSSDQNYSAAI
mgnify:CR=1 FL=1